MDSTQALQLVRVRRLVKSGEAKRLRKEAGLSLGETAGAAGISVAGLWRWEAGERVPTGDPALRYADFLGKIARSARRAS